MGEERKIEELYTRGVDQSVDNFALQHIIMITENAKMKDEEMLRFQLNQCPFSGRQRIFCESREDKNEECVFCAEPVDTVVLVYQYKKETDEVVRLYALESEGEELITK